MRFLIFCVCLFLLYSCHEKHADVKVQLTNNSQSVSITGFDAAILGDVGRDNVNGFQSLLPVYRMPTDAELKDLQPMQPGKYNVSGNTVAFTPDTPFKCGSTYFIRVYEYDNGNSALSYISEHHKPGSHPYTDVLFKK